MISRYALYDTAQLSTYFSLPGLPKGVRPQYAIAPAMNAPVIISENGSRVVKVMKWGLMASGAKDVSSIFRYKTHNIASEKIFSRHSWQQAVRQRRCLVPANGFYELDEKSQRAYYVQTSDAELCSFAGVYSEWSDPEGIVYGTYSIITIEAEVTMPASSDRIPIIINRRDEARWLDPTINDMSSLYDMLRHYPVDGFVGHEVSSEVFSSKNNSPRFIDRK